MFHWGKLCCVCGLCNARNRDDRKQKRHSGHLSQKPSALKSMSHQKVGAENNASKAAMPISSLPAGVSQQNLQPEDPPISSPSNTPATEEKRAVYVPEVPRIQHPPRQQMLQLDFDSVNRANPPSQLQPQPERLFPGWDPARVRSNSMPTPAELSHRRTPPPIVADDPSTETIFPHTITVLISLTFNGQPESYPPKETQGFEWTKPNCYKQLMAQGMVQKLQESYEELKTQDMYCRYGTCRVEGPTGRDYGTPVSMVDDYEQLSQRAIIDVCAFISKYPFKDFRLHVSWDYGSAQIKKPNNEQRRNRDFPSNYITMIRKQLGNKVQKNFLGQQYIPRRDLGTFLKLEVIDNILAEDKSLDLDETEREKFRDEILLECPKLFAICVYREIELRMLCHWVQKHGCGDNLDCRPTPGMECKDGCNRGSLHEMIATLPMFFGEKIAFDCQYHKYERYQILPLQDTGDLDPQGTAKREDLGEGNSGKVFEVKIDFAHGDITHNDLTHNDLTHNDLTHNDLTHNDLTHNDLMHNALAGNPDSRFAVKECHNLDLFKQELAILDHFADFPHAHIVPHLTTWSQRDIHYILYPKARCNLREYINGLEHPELSGQHVLWFIGQLKGLAAAIDHVHHFKRPSLANHQPKDDDYWGRHDDIKPENILVFEKAENQIPTFKIADFGLGVLYKPTGDKSRQDPPGRGTEGYFPPEKTTSRPGDMWALGCVYLELVLWLFGFYQNPEAKGFVTARMSFPGQDPNNRTDNFWYEDRRQDTRQPGVIKLKPAVQGVLNELKEKHFHAMRAFENILSAINKLLEVDPNRRYTSLTLLDKMKSILSQAEADIKGRDGDPDYYAKRLKENLGGSVFGGELPSAGIDPNISPMVTRSPSSSSLRSPSNSGIQAT